MYNEKRMATHRNTESPLFSHKLQTGKHHRMATGMVDAFHTLTAQCKCVKRVYHSSYSYQPVVFAYLQFMGRKKLVSQCAAILFSLYIHFHCR